MIETDTLLNILKEKNVRRVALQFPEGLKRHAPQTARALFEAGFDVVISGDACWGACDLALDALADADILIHFGHTPVSPEIENVIYFPYSQDIDLAVLDKAAAALGGFAKTGLVTTIQHAHQSHAMADYLRSRGLDIVLAEGSGRTPLAGQVLGCTYEAAHKENAAGAEVFLFVGTGVFHAIGVSLATKKPVYALDPYAEGAGLQEVSADRLLRKRFVQIEKARGAESFGILLSSKSGQAREALAKRLAALSPKASVVLIREISEMELRNLGFDAYVNTACPRLALDDQSRFAAPLLSPAEFEIALGLREWEEYEIDEIKAA
ncbi:MAG TPA: diphthamide biosynthesis enzyme Dph2 [Methanocorpusculum sp.]|nr:diphthamide biosynthesis enzyme Dph2 [Methanocorpusculum sp.]